MDKQEARLVLQASRPDGRDATQQVFAEALVLVECDPELKSWWMAQQNFDRKVAAKLEEVPPPSDLRATILAGRKIEQLTPGPRYYPWLAAAAVIAALFVIGSLFPRLLIIPRAAPPIASAVYNHGALADLGPDSPPLDMLSPDQDKIRAWLAQRNAPTGKLPASMAPLSTVGCQKFVVAGHNVSLTCFSLAGGGIVHLFVVDREALADPPSRTMPEFKQLEGWSTAAWSDGAQSYLLVTEADPDKLRQLLGFHASRSAGSRSPSA